MPSKSEPLVFIRANPDKDFDRDEEIIGCFPIVIYSYSAYRNAWHGSTANYGGITTFSISIEEIRRKINSARSQGTSISIHEHPSIALAGENCSLIFTVISKTTFKSPDEIIFEEVKSFAKIGQILHKTPGLKLSFVIEGPVSEPDRKPTGTTWWPYSNYSKSTFETYFELKKLCDEHLGFLVRS